MEIRRCPLCGKKRLFFVELKTEMRNIPTSTLFSGVCICIECLRNPKINVQEAFLKVARED